MLQLILSNFEHVVRKGSGREYTVVNDTTTLRQIGKKLLSRALADERNEKRQSSIANIASERQEVADYNQVTDTVVEVVQDGRNRTINKSEGIDHVIEVGMQNKDLGLNSSGIALSTLSSIGLRILFKVDGKLYEMNEDEAKTWIYNLIRIRIRARNDKESHEDKADREKHLPVLRRMLHEQNHDDNISQETTESTAPLPNTKRSSSSQQKNVNQSKSTKPATSTKKSSSTSSKKKAPNVKQTQDQIQAEAQAREMMESQAEALTWASKKYRTSIIHNIRTKVQGHFYKCHNKYLPVANVPEILCTSLPEFATTIEKRFKNGMTWLLLLTGKNKIHLDHRTAKKTKRTDLPKERRFGVSNFTPALWHWTNYWPEWADVNVSKGNREHFPNRKWNGNRWIEESEDDNELLAKCFEVVEE